MMRKKNLSNQKGRNLEGMILYPRNIIIGRHQQLIGNKFLLSKALQ